jgi:hypothetical protein
MPGEVLMALAQFAGQTVAAAAVTDVWETARHKVARLLGRGDPRKTEVAEQWLAETRQQVTSAADHSVTAGRDVNITASGGVAAGVVHGNVTPNPIPPGPADN